MQIGGSAPRRSWILQEALGGACDDHELAQPVGGLANERTTYRAIEGCGDIGNAALAASDRPGAAGASRACAPHRAQHCAWTSFLTGVGVSPPASMLQVAPSSAATIGVLSDGRLAPAWGPAAANPWNTSRVRRQNASVQANSDWRRSPLSLSARHVISVVLHRRFLSRRALRGLRCANREIGDHFALRGRREESRESYVAAADERM